MTSRPTSSGDAADQPRGELLDALLSHVPFDGWTRRAVDRAAADIGRTPFDAHRAFPGGVAQIIDYHSARADRDMTQALAAVDMIPMRIRDRITLAVRTRLEQNTADREAIRRAVAYLALPFHAGLASRCLYRTVDAMWYAVGDTATDFSFYTKRATLAGVYASTLMVWMNESSHGDPSPDGAETWAFLARRIDGVMQIPKRRARLRQACGRLTKPLGLLRGAKTFIHRRVADRL